MTSIRKLLTIALGGLAFGIFGTVATAQSGAPFVYVSGGPSGQVYTAAPPSVAAALFSDAHRNQVEGMVLGPDKMLYVCEPEAGIIVRFDPTAASPVAAVVFQSGGTSGLGQPQCGHFTASGDLLVSDETPGSGIWEFPAMAGSSNPISPQNVLGSGQLGSGFVGSGLTQLKNGDLAFVDQAKAQVYLAPYSSVGLHFTTASAISLPSSTLNTPTGIARNSANDIFISNGAAANNIVRLHAVSGVYAPTAAPCASFTSTSDRPMFMQFSADDTLYVASQTTSGEIFANPGKVWSVAVTSSACGTPVLVATLPRYDSDNDSQAEPNHTPDSDDAYAPGIGIALPATHAAVTQPAFSGTQIFNFNFSALEIIATCSIPTTVTETQTFPADVETLFGTFPMGVSAATAFLGEGGFVNVFTVTGCGTPPIDYSMRLGALLDSSQTNPRIVQCDSGSCLVVPTTGVYPLGSLVPGDLVTAARGHGFSNFYLTNLPLGTTAGQPAGNFCFEFPFNLSKQPVFDADDFAFVTFKLTTGTGCTGSPIKTAQALLSVAQITDASGNSVFNPVNPSNPLNPGSPGLFNFVPFFNVYTFLLNFHGLAPGTYSLSVTFLTNNAGTQTTTFQVVAGR